MSEPIIAPKWPSPGYRVDEKGKVLGAVPGTPNNWDRWGCDDEIGTLNLLTPERILAASRLVRDGCGFSLALPFGRTAPVLGTRPAAVVTMTSTAGDAVLGHDTRHGLQSTDEVMTTPLQTATHIDGLAHVAANDVLFNGFWAGTITTQRGATRLGGELMGRGVAGRAVLADVGRFAALDPIYGVVDRASLERTLELEEVEVGTGDILLIRTGWLGHQLATPSGRRRAAGLAPSLIHWIADKDVALVACDNRTVEAVPNPESDEVLPLHVAALRDLGMPLGELFVLDEVADHCAVTGRYDGFISMGPLPIVGSVGTPVNPIFFS
jgi:kynurenine formamidase